ncbi:MAG: glucosidase [Paludisphaera borealis]|uniref:MGH1-like glycoside hydrolase domain-containing protein n=1 Tax=Paludisphaera borealis TaxID=1387353 RepID=UPI002849BCD8|nr:glucosidase [Paludisphaera borealis]MDR3618336.1 glucosidase [Paludisphaera borealis]
MDLDHPLDAEADRLKQDARREKNWKRWGPYLSERQWATVREDYSPDGELWKSFPHDHARSRAYRWGEDGLMGICDRECRLCFALALWNENDPILKERLFGLTNPEGNHSEDVKECYYYLDSTPTHSYLKALYKYPQAAFPYERLVDENRRRTRRDPEFELIDTGIFDEGRYFDVQAEYAKAAPEDILIRVTVFNRGPESARLRVLPTLWFRNTWTWDAAYEEEGHWPRPRLEQDGEDSVRAEHATLGRFRLSAAPGPDGKPPSWIFTENDTNLARLFKAENAGPYVKDGFHACVVDGRADAVNPSRAGTKAAAHYILDIPAGGQATVRLRLSAESEKPAGDPFGPDFATVFDARVRETDAFYEARIPCELTDDERLVSRQAYAGLLWSKQFYEYILPEWLDGDRGQPRPSDARRRHPNRAWPHLYSRDVLSTPDKWEYPAFFAWDLAFHMLPFAHIDPDFAKEQLLLLLREWYMHPNGQLPACEYDLSDVNPPVHAYACWRVYKLTGEPGGRDVGFLERAFQKLLLNFTWWVNRQDAAGDNVFAGGFLGLDNIGVFDRSKGVPAGGRLEQADGTAWMGFYCTTMLAIAIELARFNPSYEDVASKFFEHFIQIADALNHLGGDGLWHEEDGFYYDHLRCANESIPLRVRSLVGWIPLLAVEVLEEEIIHAELPQFQKRLFWFLKFRKDLLKSIALMDRKGEPGSRRLLLALPGRERLVRALRRILDESEFLSPYGVRSMSRAYKDQPYVFRAGGQEYRVAYMPGDMETTDFGGNSNWRGPVWFPVNHLLVEALQRYHHFYGDDLKVECPTGSGKFMNLLEVAHEIGERLGRLFRPDEQGSRPGQGPERRFANDPHWRNLVLFHEYFHGDDGRGLGASHQTGWTALITRHFKDCAQGRRAEAGRRTTPTK